MSDRTSVSFLFSVPTIAKLYVFGILFFGRKCFLGFRSHLFFGTKLRPKNKWDRKWRQLALWLHRPPWQTYLLLLLTPACNCISPSSVVKCTYYCVICRQISQDSPALLSLLPSACPVMSICSANWHSLTLCCLRQTIEQWAGDVIIPSSPSLSAVQSFTSYIWCGLTRCPN